MRRGQASITAVEAALGVLLVTSVVLTFGLGVPDGSDQRTQAQLDRYAADTATILATEPPRHGDRTRVAEVLQSAESWERERAEFERRVDRILPDNVMFRVETAYGTVGDPLPADVQTGDAQLVTPNGDATLRVWYA